MGVQFEENNIVERRFPSEKTPKLAGWLISKGFVKTVSGANKLQLVFVVVLFVLAIYFAF